MNTHKDAGRRNYYHEENGQHLYSQSAEPPPEAGGMRDSRDGLKNANQHLGHLRKRVLCDPTSYCESPRTSESGDSMHSPPSHSPTKAGSPNADVRLADFIGRTSLDNEDERMYGIQRGRAQDVAPTVLAAKRSASSHLAKPGSCQSPRVCHSPEPLPRRPTPQSRLQKRNSHDRSLHRRIASSDRLKHRGPPLSCMKPGLPGVERLKSSVPRDSGYESDNHTNLPSALQAACSPLKVPATLHENPDRAASTITLPHDEKLPPKKIAGSDGILSDIKHSAYRYQMLLQPDSSPISQDQLAAEVKGIYAGLVMVEAKCINLDDAQAADPKSQLGPDQWQALIALHRTLLYEHHDFLMATQHPSATPALRGLATKYSMPARMWKHGIHAFLEVLRHRRPDSQDHMLAFIYLAYQMMALLYETVPSFTDTWIECLGDLARYRMAIEEDRETHTTWGGVASRWYTLASDRHPAIGRLYHHLGILERPSLRKYCYYSKSLTCVIPFPNARDSLATLCGPIVQDEQTIESSRQSAEARIVTYHALVFARRDRSVVDAVGQDCLHLLQEQPPKLRDFGANLAVTNVATQFELGSSTNTLWQLYTAVISQQLQNSRPSLSAGINSQNGALDTIVRSAPSPLLESTRSFTFNCINFVLRQYNDPDCLEHSLPFVHVSLVWLHSLHSLEKRMGHLTAGISHGNLHRTDDIPFRLGRLVSFPALTAFLNTLASQAPNSITSRMLECARQGVFLASEQSKDDGNIRRPLAEDFTIRGLIWSQFYFCPGWFDGQNEDDGRNIETDATAKARVERVLWLGLFLAFQTEFLKFDVHRKVFEPLQQPPEQSVEEAKTAEEPVVDPAANVAVPITDMLDFKGVEQASLLVAPGSRASVGTDFSSSSSSSNSEDGGWQKVKKPPIGPQKSPPTQTQQQQRSYAKTAAHGKTNNTPSKHTKNQNRSQNMNDFQVVGEDGNIEGMQGEAIRTGHS